MNLETDAAPADPTLLSWLVLGMILLGIALALYCIFTIYRNKHFDEVHKLGWLLLALALPIFGPIAWMVRSHQEKKHRARPDYVEASVGGEDWQDGAVPASEHPRTFRPRTVAATSDVENLNTGDSPENPFITQNQDGTRGLKF
ncbi:PLDc N-terminal domain-containing protein [Rothia aerolata]|uniref:Cardiolipin synthase N-terminal domain-containing protein n=1 Tax=Rothia aerolata TaxID=1812262 RepID=A0A917MVQ5_9MICC|nr:PLDc N-terminal domain-containing protein [Rothia aerolata]GGH67065.1 hypothetical protein GCM10007359_21820 [Rothia aerolata]